MTTRYMSRQEIADYLGVSLSTVKQAKDIPPPDVIVGRNQGWAKDTITKWWNSRP
jgi:hypothetical protein